MSKLNNGGEDIILFWKNMPTTSKNIFCSFYLTQGIYRSAVILHAVTTATTSSARITTQACSRWQSRPVQTLLLSTVYTHACYWQSWPALSANLKRKMRSWWGAEGPVQRRPVAGCTAEKVLRSTDKNTEKKKGRKREKRQKTWTVVSEWIRRKAVCLLFFWPTCSQKSCRSFFSMD